MAIKQFVNSQVCLSCDGCCRFHLAESPWRPKVGEAEYLAKLTDQKGYLPTQPLAHQHRCQYLNPVDNTCQAYDHRPFECALYPFVLSCEDGQVKCWVHLACPFVQDQLNSDYYQRYKAYLKDYFSTGTFRLWLSENTRLLHDYRHAKDELMWVFDLTITM